MNASIEQEATPDIAQREAANTTGPSIKLKASMATMTCIELSHFEPAQFEQELLAKTSQAPGFFENLPVILGLESFPENSLDFDSLLSICAGHSVRVIAVRGASDALQQQAKTAGLGILAKKNDKITESETSIDPSVDNQPAVEEPQAQEKPAPAVVTETKTQVSKIVHHPIRSGQQVYAADGDLIVLAPVSAGAEILADGNIHVYGALRGRALAGVKGNTKARIFCHSMAAELVSIAGQYKISEDIPSSVIGKPCQVQLEEDALKFKRLEL